MKRQIAFGLGCFLLLFSATAATAAHKLPSPPTAALLYPNEIYLTVEEKLSPEALPGKGRRLVIVLPPPGRYHDLFRNRGRRGGQQLLLVEG